MVSQCIYLVFGSSVKINDIVYPLLCTNYNMAQYLHVIAYIYLGIWLLNGYRPQGEPGSTYHNASLYRLKIVTLSVWCPDILFHIHLSHTSTLPLSGLNLAVYQYTRQTEYQSYMPLGSIYKSLVALGHHLH